MKKMIKLILLVLLFYLNTPFLFSSITHSQDLVEFLLVNQTSFWITLYIDGEKSCSTQPGDQCADLVTPGKHYFRVEQTDDKSNYANRTIDVPIGGYTWTITEN